MARRLCLLAAPTRRRCLVALLTFVAVALITVEGWRSPAFAQDVIAFPPTGSAPSSNIFDTANPVAANSTPQIPVQEPLPDLPPTRFVLGLEEPLIATSTSNSHDDADLDSAIASFRNLATPTQDFLVMAAPLATYISTHPKAAWNTALLTNLGLGYYNAGYFSRAFDAWQKAWLAGRNATSPQAKALTDRAVGELARMHARVGHADALDALFADIGTRPISGSATEAIAGAHEALWAFRNNYAQSYLCGPQALKNVMTSRNANATQIKVADDARSGPNGFSLDQVYALAAQAGFAVTLIYRAPGQPVPVPSVVNWNVHHYAALTAIDNNRFHLQDPTFSTGDLAVTQSAIDSESSGYFVVPSDVVSASPKSGWRIVDPASAEAKAVYGMGQTSSNDPATKPEEIGTGCAVPSPGQAAPQRSPMCQYNLYKMAV